MVLIKDLAKSETAKNLNYQHCWQRRLSIYFKARAQGNVDKSVNDPITDIETAPSLSLCHHLSLSLSWPVAIRKLSPKVACKTLNVCWPSRQSPVIK